jgi:hypothetical protein
LLGAALGQIQGNKVFLFAPPSDFGLSEGARPTVPFPTIHFGDIVELPSEGGILVLEFLKFSRLHGILLLVPQQHFVLDFCIFESIIEFAYFMLGCFEGAL